MSEKEQIVQNRDRFIKSLTDLMMINPFTFEFKVVENPQGIKIVYEVTQEQMNGMMKRQMKGGGE